MKLKCYAIGYTEIGNDIPTWWCFKSENLVKRFVLGCLTDNKNEAITVSMNRQGKLAIPGFTKLYEFDCRINQIETQRKNLAPADAKSVAEAFDFGGSDF